MPRQEYPCKKSTTRARTTATAHAARRHCRPRGRDLRGHVAGSSRLFLLNLKIKPSCAKNRYSCKTSTARARATSPARAARRGTLPAEKARPAHYGRRARASSFAKSESRTSPREESLPMQHVINHKTARGSRSEERHIDGRESTTCAKEKEETKRGRRACDP